MTESKLITFGYLDLPAGHPENRSTYRICGSRTRQEQSNPYCHRPAGWGTSHAGVGRCKLHGGCSLAGPKHPNWQGGRYAHLYRGRLRQQLEELGANEPKPLDLLPELEVERVLLSLALSRIGKSNRIDQNDSQGVGSGGIGQSASMGSLAYHPREEFSPSNSEMMLLTNLTHDIVDTVAKINLIRSKNSLTKGEVAWLINTLRRGINQFIPEEKCEAFLKWIGRQLAITGVEEVN